MSLLTHISIDLMHLVIFVVEYPVIDIPSLVLEKVENLTVKNVQIYIFYDIPQPKILNA